MRLKLDVVKHNSADWTRSVEAAMNARAAELAAANAELDVKIRAAKTTLAVHQNEYLHESRFFKRRLRLFKASRDQFAGLTRSFEHAQAVVFKLEKAKELIASLQRDDLTKQSEIAGQQAKITPLWDALNAKVLAGDDWDDTDKANYKKIETAQNFIAEIETQILQNTRRIAFCHRLATAYDDAHPEQFPGHWLNSATVIVEQQDRYGFIGRIEQKNEQTPHSAGTGLEGYSTGYAAMLLPNEKVCYRLPGTKVVLEQDHSGKILDKTPVDAPVQYRALAAIKMANLLLLDRIRHPEKPIVIQGGAESLQQAQLIVAALQLQAKQLGLVLKSRDLKIVIPGWRNWRGSERETKAMIAHYTGQIEGVIVHHHAQNELAKKIRAVRGKKLVENEPTYPPIKH